MASGTSSQNRFFGPRNAVTRIDVFDDVSHTQLAALRSFFRRLGAPHLLDEVVLPTLEDGDSSVFVAVRDRPWPPWGVGARHISAVCQVQEVSDESYAVSPVYVTDEDSTNVGLAAALYKEVLESLMASPRAEVNYLVADGATLTPKVLEAAGLKRSEDVFLTEDSRYYTWRAPVADVHARLGLDGAETPDLLADAFSESALMTNALFHQTILNAARAEWVNRVSEVIGLVRGGHAGKPGGVPGGTGRWGWVSDPPDWFFLTLENFLGEERQKALDFALSNEDRFEAATVVDEKGERVDESQRKNRTITDLGDLEGLFAERIKQVIAPTLSRLKMEEFPIGRIEVQMTASGDGDYFHLHRDGDETTSRALSFVYFFHNEPRRFSGGELRIFDNDAVDGQPRPFDRSQMLSPRQDLIVMFPSINEHELLPVRVASKSFADSRFTVNGWVHRAEG